MDPNYISRRRARGSYRYRLKRRTEEVSSALRSLRSGVRLDLLDVGCADGKGLSVLKGELSLRRAAGIEPNFHYLKEREDGGLLLAAARGEVLPFKGGSFDVLLAMSLVDHLEEPDLFLKESRRVLRAGGLLLLTQVTPFFDRLASSFGIATHHRKTFSPAELTALLKGEGFSVRSVRRFALPSHGLLPGERHLEGLLRGCGLGFLLFYYLVVAESLG